MLRATPGTVLGPVTSVENALTTSSTTAGAIGLVLPVDADHPVPAGSLALVALGLSG
ncbi:MAG: hypothetical protein FJ090_20720 [Deltaproteobacteria bacterium]|nr:hypothetical protein [Deltaproteobacteria bacterium]